jgi:hypothetical protein
MAGILSFLFVDLSAFIAVVPQPPGEPPVALPPLALLKVISLIQPTIILTLAVLVGVWLAEQVGLHTPAAEAWIRGQSYLAPLRPQLLPGVLAGFGSGVALVISWVVAKPFLSVEFVARAQDFNLLLPHITRILYGGITEELLLRWGVMTFLVWLVWRLFQKGKGAPKPVYVVTAIVLSALLFGLGHLPIAFMLAGGLTVPLVIYVITVNSLFGIVAGLSL